MALSAGPPLTSRLGPHGPLGPQEVAGATPGYSSGWSKWLCVQTLVTVNTMQGLNQLTVSAQSRHSKCPPNAADAVRIPDIGRECKLNCVESLPLRHAHLSQKPTKPTGQRLTGLNNKHPACFGTQGFERRTHTHPAGSPVCCARRAFNIGMTGCATMRVTSAESTASSVAVEKIWCMRSG